MLNFNPSPRLSVNFLIPFPNATKTQTKQRNQVTYRMTQYLIKQGNEENSQYNNTVINSTFVIILAEYN